MEETNFDLQHIITPVDITRLEQLLRFYEYDEAETELIISGFFTMDFQ